VRLKRTEYKSDKFANLLAFPLQVVHEYGDIASMLTGTVVVGGKKSNVIAPGTQLGLVVRQEAMLALRRGKAMFGAYSFSVSVFFLVVDP